MKKYGWLGVGLMALVAILPGSAMASFGTAVIADGAAGYWDFESTSATTIFDQSGNGRNAFYRADTASYTVGQAGRLAGTNAVYFTPNGVNTDDAAFSADYTPSQNPFAYGMSFSIEAWINTPAKSPNNTNAVFFASRGYGFGLNENGNLQFTTYGRKDWIFTGATVARNEWHMVGATMSADGQTVTFYVDGVNVGNVTDAGQSGANSATVSPFFAIGCRSGANSGVGTANGFYGSIDDLAVFGTALTDGQVAAHYAASIPEPATMSLLVLGGLAMLRRRK